MNALRQTLNTIDRGGFSDPVTANVISKNAGNWFQMFTVDAGEAKGIGVNSIVIGSGASLAGFMKLETIGPK